MNVINCFFVILVTFLFENIYITFFINSKKKRVTKGIPMPEIYQVSFNIQYHATLQILQNNITISKFYVIIIFIADRQYLHMHNNVYIYRERETNVFIFILVYHSFTHLLQHYYKCNQFAWHYYYYYFYYIRMFAC